MDGGCICCPCSCTVDDLLDDYEFAETSSLFAAKIDAKLVDGSAPTVVDAARFAASFSLLPS